VIQGLLIFALGVAPLVLLEGGLRLFGWPTERVRTFGKLLIFDEDEWNATVGVFRAGARATVSWPPELAYKVHINALGLRGPEIEPTPPPGRTRILVLGDSHTFGYYLEESETWPAQLQASLRRNGRDVEVVNGGCGGWSIDSETLFTLERALALEPDPVIIGFFANDIDDLQRDEPLYVSQQRALRGAQAKLTQLVYTSASYELYLRAQVAWKDYRESVRSEESPDGIPRPASPIDEAPYWEMYAKWLGRLRTALDERGIGLSIVYIPHAAEIVHGEVSQNEARMIAIASELGIPAASPKAAFRSAREDATLFHLPIDPHLGETGAKLVALAAREVVPRD
jgi:lysophospholipase L1-like esterase